MDDLSRFCCQKPECPLYGRRGAGNLSVRDRYGKDHHIRLLYCKACKARFANHESPKTTKLYDRTGNAIDLDDIELIMI
jgi:hypothetical protein